jgi:hypothetical protein
MFMVKLKEKSKDGGSQKKCSIKCNIHPTQKLGASVQTLPLLAVELYMPELLSVSRK